MGPRRSRRAFLSVAAMTATTGCVTGLARQPAAVEPPPTDVPAYHGRGGRHGATGSRGPEGLVERKWQTLVEGEAAVPPAIVDGVAYVADAEGVVHAIDGGNGSVRWRNDVGGDSYGWRTGGTPTVVDGVVHAAIGEALVALDAADGAERWRFSERGEGSPAVFDERVFYGDGHGIRSVAPDGVGLWTFDSGENLLESPSLHPTPTVVDGLCHVGVDDREPLTDRTVYALDADRGEPAWTRRTGYGRHSTAVVADGVVYYGATDHESDGHGALLALDAADGTVRWRRRFDARAVSTPTFEDGRLYVGSSRGVRALDADDGTVRWRFARDRSEPDRYEFSDTAPVEAGSPVVGTNALYVPARVESDARLYALSKNDGRPLWRRAGAYHGPIPLDGTVYATREAGRILGPESRLVALGEYRRGEP